MNNHRQAQAQHKRATPIVHKTGSVVTSDQTSIEGLRPFVNQLNQYFETTRRSPVPSRA